MRTKEMIAELLEVTRAVQKLLENQQLLQQKPERVEMNLGSADDIVQRYKSLSKQKRQAVRI